ncbi:MAG: hypothetical protein UR36_C0002G0036 [candidate division WS6 bacterium GW2011_GWF1_33_233]|nr:MAG: hypothetical protein UR36_C0002G0036 [candidate division WS6 bacterium GW2011_GWF1_33_233]
MGGILEQKAVLSSEFETPTSDIKQKTPLGTTIIHYAENIISNLRIGE